MSKVVHLSDDAHAKAKNFCRKNGFKMSDWVASLIDSAISSEDSDMMEGSESEDANIRAFVPKKKVLQRLDEAAPQPAAEEGVPPYAQPPFWKRASK